MKRITVIASLMFSAAAIVVACKENETSTPNGGASSSGGTSGGTSSGGTSSGDNGGATVKSGSVTATQSIMDVGGTDYITVMSMASFSETTTGGSSSGSITGGCKTSTEGDCTIQECDITADETETDAGTADDGGSKKSPTAGDVKIAGLRDVTLTPDPTTGSYKTQTDTPPAATRLWAGGDDVKITAAGAEVPAFDKTLKAPAAITVTAPEFPELGGKLTVPRNADLTITWEDGTAGDVTASMSTSSVSGNTVKTASVICKFKADAGTGKVPSAALGKLLAGDGSVNIGASANDLVDQDGWKINLSLIGGGASGLATFQ